MKNYFLYVFISLFLFSLSSCKDDKDVVAVLELGLENADFYKEAGSVVIDVKSLLQIGPLLWMWKENSGVRLNLSIRVQVRRLV